MVAVELLLEPRQERAVTPSAGSIIGGRFKLVRELGTGSMGTVWLADHLTLDLRCAVKFMSAEATNAPNYRARFELEARAIAQLHGPNVVRILDYDVHEGTPFIAMEFLRGEDLAARLLRVGKLDAATTYRIISQVARGLSKAHEAGIVHRDLKPENIFLAEEDEGEVAKLVDFGIAKMAPFALGEALSDRTQAGSLLGTPTYMSPEQARGLSDIDHRSDLWSLAVITFECLTGRLPFESAALGDLFAQIMFEDIPVPSKIDRSLPIGFDPWWARAVSRNAAGRFGSARELSEALGQALELQGAADDSLDVTQTADGVVRSVTVVPRVRESKKLFFGSVAVAVVLIGALLSAVAPGPAVASAGVRGGVNAARIEGPRAPLPDVLTIDPATVILAPSAAASNVAAPSAGPSPRHSRFTVTVVPSSQPTPRSAPPRQRSSKPSADDVDFGI
jgi:serine/threonine protein kinase